MVDRIAKNSIESFPEIGVITISLGVAYYPNSLEHYELSFADQALYQAKHNGKNQVITFIYSG
ncbi:diguanylate cyclase [Vibrio metschnikovii]